MSLEKQKQINLELGLVGGVAGIPKVTWGRITLGIVSDGCCGSRIGAGSSSFSSGSCDSLPALRTIDRRAISCNINDAVWAIRMV